MPQLRRHSRASPASFRRSPRGILGIVSWFRAPGLRGFGGLRGPPPRWWRPALAAAASEPICTSRRGLSASPAPVPAATALGSGQRDAAPTFGHAVAPQGRRPAPRAETRTGRRAASSVAGGRGCSEQPRPPGRSRGTPRGRARPLQLLATDARPAPSILRPRTCPWGAATSQAPGTVSQALPKPCNRGGAPLRGQPCAGRGPCCHDRHTDAFTGGREEGSRGDARGRRPSPALRPPLRSWDGGATTPRLPREAPCPGRGLLGPSPAGGRGAPATAPRGSILLGHGGATCPVRVRGLSPAGL